MSTTTKEISIGDIGSRGAEANSKLDGDIMALNVGPSHPTTHGVLRLIMEKVQIVGFPRLFIYIH